MSCSREVEVALRYLQQVISSQSPHLILNSATAVLDAVSVNCDNKDSRLQKALVRLLRCTDRDYVRPNAAPNTEEIRDAVQQLTQLVRNCARTTDAGVSGNCAPSPPEIGSKNETDRKASKSPTTEEFSAQTLAEEQTLDELLNKLNLRHVPKFSPNFPDEDIGESDEDCVMTTDERKEEREEKHGQKLCEEQVQKMPDGTEVRVKKTRTVNVQQSRKHVTISSRGGGIPGMTRHFTDGRSAMEENEEEEESDFFKRDPFDRFQREHSPEHGLNALQIHVKGAGHSTKTKSVERTSEISQSVSERKERDGQVLRENAAQKLDSSALTARQTDTFLGTNLLDRKGEGSYEECNIVRCGPLAVGPQPVLPPRKHVVEYIQTFGNKENTDIEFFRGTALSSYISLHDNLRYHEEQFRKRLQFEFSSPEVTAKRALEKDEKDKQNR